ncbi:hypothetical protein ZIOFF_067064 [Zingiber officinale]|uniref:D-lactate dehydrogenase (cytochrome) n=1 Tax=Zingiber officinale TaxID=94328 RepID=A0A8J5C5U2_ZINOF|nr:hypothetical protein ZIOFF_067064 [Zingiber officinale]
MLANDPRLFDRFMLGKTRRDPFDRRGIHANWARPIKGSNLPGATPPLRKSLPVRSLSTMGFLSAFFSRVASKPHLRRCFRGVPLQYATALGTDASGDRLLPWSRALVPLAVAAGAALAFDLRPVAAPSLCDPGVDIRVGGKDSTEVVVKGVHREVPKEFIAELKDILQDNLTLDYEERYFHGKPQNSFHRSVNVPDVVVFPRSQGDVQKVVAACNMYKVPIVPYGGATSIEGHTLAPHGGVCVDMSLMKVMGWSLVEQLKFLSGGLKDRLMHNVALSSPSRTQSEAQNSRATLLKSGDKIKSLNVEDLDIVVEPGIGWMELNEYLKPYGLFFPLDPGPGATIGGMCATRCSGSLAVRYGTMRDNVINVQVVLANGEVIKTGSRARKSAAGYDLTRLLIGSEGTLGIITEVTLRLQRLPQHSVLFIVYKLFDTAVYSVQAVKAVHSSVYSVLAVRHSCLFCTRYESCSQLFNNVAMCNFQTIKDAADVAIATMLSGIQVSRVELLDEVQVKAINFANGKSLPEVPTLMFEFIGTGDRFSLFCTISEAYAREQTLIVQKIVSEHNGSDFVFVESENSKEELWKASFPIFIRKEALWACYAMAPDNSDAMITDVCVPLSRLAECISKSKEELDASPLMCMVIAHAGDGNFHTIIMFDPEQEEQRQEAERLNHFMVQTALSLEGTCTGEHGVGTGKMKYLEKELGIGALRTMKSIKSVLDPNDIMNPGKIIPPHVCI